MSEWIWLFNVTFNDISVIYVTAHRCAGGSKKKLNLRSGSQRHKHFVGFFNVPVQAPTRDPPFYSYSEKPPHFSRLLRHAWGRRTHSRLKPPGPHGGIKMTAITKWNRWDGRKYTNARTKLHLKYKVLVMAYANVANVVNDGIHSPRIIIHSSHMRVIVFWNLLNSQDKQECFKLLCPANREGCRIIWYACEGNGQ